MVIGQYVETTNENIIYGFLQFFNHPEKDWETLLDVS